MKVVVRVSMMIRAAGDARGLVHYEFILGRAVNKEILRLAVSSAQLTCTSVAGGYLAKHNVTALEHTPDLSPSDIFLKK
jgi:hypothetical protein